MILLVCVFRLLNPSYCMLHIHFSGFDQILFSDCLEYFCSISAPKTLQYINISCVYMCNVKQYYEVWIDKKKPLRWLDGGKRIKSIALRLRRRKSVLYYSPYLGSVNMQAHTTENSWFRHTQNDVSVSGLINLTHHVIIFTIISY